MLIDGQAIRDKARQDYQKVLRDLQQARQDLERFETLDKPKFNGWIHRQFGALITELREATQKLQTTRELLSEIESEAFLSNCSHVRAYERVMWRRQHPEEAEEQARQEEEAEARRRRGASGSQGADPFAEETDEFFADFEEEFARMFNTGPRSERPEVESSPPRQTHARLKELYRAVVRRLHPDMHEAVTAQKQEWWHQAQAAYQSGDVDQLQVILTLCEIEEQGSTAKTSVSLLARITRQFKSSLRTLRSQLQRCRRDPAWNFSNLRSRGDLLERSERQLKSDLRELRSLLDSLEAQIGCWARQARAPGRRPSRKRRAAEQPEFYF
jgi:hypothetical protein